MLDLAQRWYSAVIGEGVIFDLRTALYDHVHRMPIAFFTRTQTGALPNRPTPPGLVTNSPSLHQTQGGSDLVERRFVAERPNQLWLLADITYCSIEPPEQPVPIV